ncbi:hypothetical protein PSU4_47550 [Pseudonocardia sulfidoxydans NBRC 16205]|uniref:2'-5' RNA ligase n=1 Tax=Pseudonocardia sulfidoxydans NBRC 16205 TaxID=1223511 RepID=A0A511DLW1_9PSEU|nr:2'-5' RNA ligase family protein [Pseudonocardia sulfidoxydans]GEL25801.1 hypothetical protein PSU4_47550 [Pseudonocardia sulfidoxydans NBRC 16205]
MVHAVRFRLADDAADELTGLRARLVVAGLPVPVGRPAVTVAAATTIPAATRSALATAVGVLVLPTLWLTNLAAVAGRDEELVLGAVVDTELLAVHDAVHDVLAGNVRGPVATYLPGSWVPHCVLATRDPAAAFTALHPLRPVRAAVTALELADTRTGETTPL